MYDRNRTGPRMLPWGTLRLLVWMWSSLSQLLRFVSCLLGSSFSIGAFSLESLCLLVLLLISCEEQNRRPFVGLGI
jgi:hypothetical protein